MRKIVCVGFLLLYSASFTWSQRIAERPYWYSLERGKQFFRIGDYGNALMAFEDAKRDRRDMYTRMESDLIALLSNPEVRRMGDSLALIEPYIVERYQMNAAIALEELYYRVPKARIGGSATRALEEIDLLKAYPEAEYWLGETYRAEGELEVALNQYQRAYNLRAYLENPAFDVEILYKMIDMLKIKQDYNGMKARIEEILVRDSLYTGPVNTMIAMARLLTDSGVDRLLMIYRHDNTTSERAYRLLGLYYYASREPRPEGYAALRLGLAAENLLVALLIQNTVLINELIRNQYDFAFTSLDELIVKAEANPILVDYMKGCEYYKTIYYFAAALHADGKAVTARGLWTLLSQHPEAGEWSNRAKSQLRAPFVEQ
jgi:tetratricopeptide (TPR) repeat protein